MFLDVHKMSPQSFLCPYFSSFCAKNIFLLACNSLLYAVLIFIENCWRILFKRRPIMFLNGKHNGTRFFYLNEHARESGLCFTGRMIQGSKGIEALPPGQTR